MKIKLFAACEIQYFELGIFSFNSYVYYLTHGFIASIRAFNSPTHVFSLTTRAFNLTACAFSFLTRGFELVICRFELVTRVLLSHLHDTDIITLLEKIKIKIKINNMEIWGFMMKMILNLNKIVGLREDNSWFIPLFSKVLM